MCSLYLPVGQKNIRFVSTFVYTFSKAFKTCKCKALDKYSALSH